MVFQHTLDGQRQIVVTRTFAIARAGNRVLPCMVSTALVVGPGRNDADALPFQHRERQAAEIEHDMVGVVVLAGAGACLGHAHIADHAGFDGFFCRLGTVQIGIGMGGRPGGQDRAIGGVVERRGRRRRRFNRGGQFDRAHALLGELLRAQFGRQFIPLELRFN